MGVYITEWQDGVTSWSATDMNPPIVALDAVVARNHNVIVSCAGSILYNKITGSLAWSGTIQIMFIASNGNLISNTIAANSVTLADNEMAYVDLNESNGSAVLMGTAALSTGVASTTVATLRLVMGYRDSTSDNFFGVALTQPIGYEQVLNNFSATSNPLVTSDSAAGYSVGSKWVNTTTDVQFSCVDASAGAAIWVQTGATTSVKDNFTAVVDPTVTDDDSLVYAVGSRWINTVLDSGFICTDATTGAAIWARIFTTGESSFLNLSDTPASYVGHGGKVCVINDTADGVEFLSPDNVGKGAYSTTAYEYTASATHATFTGADDNLNTLDLDGYNEMVVVNGIFLSPDEYTRSSTSIILDVPAPDGVDVTIWAITGTSAIKESFMFAVTNEVSDLSLGTSKITFRMPYKFTLDLNGVRASVNTAPTDADILVDINRNGTSIFQTNKLMIDATEFTSVTASTSATLATLTLYDDDEITVDIDQVGSTIPGIGLKIVMLGIQS